jgi:signal transduction histidine kinase
MQAPMAVDARSIELLANVAHELRTPLATISLAVEALGALSNGGAAEHSRALIKRQLQRLCRLTEDLMDVARLETGKFSVHPERVNLVAAVRRVTESAHAAISARGHTLMIEFPASELYADIDPARFEQVLINLIDNSIKYSERFGRILVSLMQEGAQIVLRVQDQGIGIPQEMLPHVFGLFVQGALQTSHQNGGVGIGLNLVKNIVELHGGCVEARSAGPGRGSEFIVRLPV